MRSYLTVLLALAIYLPNTYALTNAKVIATDVHPEVVQLLLKIKVLTGSEESNAACTGTYVGPKTILTAAHCVISPEKSKDIKSFPIAKIGTASQISIDGKAGVKVEKIIYHFGMDLAVLVLDTATDKFIPVSVEEPLPVTTDIKMIGFGLPCAWGCDYDGLKREGSNTINYVMGNKEVNGVGGIIRLLGKFGYSDMTEAEKLAYNISTETIQKDLSSSYGSAATDGDSGSPLIQSKDGSDVVIGVYSSSVPSISSFSKGLLDYFKKETASSSVVDNYGNMSGETFIVDLIEKLPPVSLNSSTNEYIYVKDTYSSLFNDMDFLRYANSNGADIAFDKINSKEFKANAFYKTIDLNKLDNSAEYKLQAPAAYFSDHLPDALRSNPQISCFDTPGYKTEYVTGFPKEPKENTIYIMRYSKELITQLGVYVFNNLVWTDDEAFYNILLLNAGTLMPLDPCPATFFINPPSGH